MNMCNGCRYLATDTTGILLKKHYCSKFDTYLESCTDTTKPLNPFVMVIMCDSCLNNWGI